MRLDTPHALQLTYCTNIHPSKGIDEVRANLERYAPPLRERFAPHKPSGIGLRLSGEESRELLEGDRLETFKSFLDAHGLYVFTLNGFPYGPFHGQPVKAQVHAPDWRSDERVAYTLRLVEILAALLPEGLHGSISTSPLSYRAWIEENTETWQLLTENVVEVVTAMVTLERETGQLIHLDLEPEPDGLLANSRDLADWFERWLLTHGAEHLAHRLEGSDDDARAALRTHVRACFDTCHAAVMYESPAEVLGRFGEVGIQVGKVQISSALRIPLGDSRTETARALAPFAESTYLHQVVQRNRDGTLTNYPDLPEALPRITDPTACEWRVHFHVPLFTEGYGTFGSTQNTIHETFALLRERPFTEHLEIETYTWEVLPEGLKTELGASIAREYAWVLDAL